MVRIGRCNYTYVILSESMSMCSYMSFLQYKYHNCRGHITVKQYYQKIVDAGMFSCIQPTFVTFVYTALDVTLQDTV